MTDQIANNASPATTTMWRETHKSASQDGHFREATIAPRNVLLTPETWLAPVAGTLYRRLSEDEAFERIGGVMAERMRAYHPREMPIDRWEAIRSFVLRVVAATAPLNVADPIAHVGRIARFVDWAHNIHAHPLDEVGLFNRPMIGAYTVWLGTKVQPPTVQNVRGWLLRIAEIVNPAEVHKMPPLGRQNVRAPYTPAERAEVWSFATSQATAHRRINASKIVALGLGFGLAAGDLRLLKNEQIEFIDDLALVHIEQTQYSNLPRTIVAFADITPILRDLFDPSLPGNGPDNYAVLPNSHSRKHHNLFSYFIEQLDGTGLRPSPQRLRSTWLVRHLELGTPTPLLREAYGVTSLEAINRYLSFVPEVGWDDKVRFLTGQRS